MIYDVISYNGEKDLLNLRLRILSPYVDYFVVCEAKTTFSGNAKPLFFSSQEAFFKPFWSQIDYHVIDEEYSKEEIEFARKSPSVPAGQDHWLREFLQKESIKKALTALEDEDLCFVSDCDEIWNPKIISVIQKKPDELYKLEQRVYVYWLNNRSNERWAGTYATSYKTLKNKCINHMRTRDAHILIPNAGWHFTNMGGEKELRRKLESYGHQEFNVPNIKNNLKKSLEDNTDYIGRNFTFWIDEKDWPSYLTRHRYKYSHLCK